MQQQSEQTATLIIGLPNEMVYGILYFLDTRELARITLLNHAWKQAVLDIFKLKREAIIKLIETGPYYLAEEEYEKMQTELKAKHSSTFVKNDDETEITATHYELYGCRFFKSHVFKIMSLFAPQEQWQSYGVEMRDNSTNCHYRDNVVMYVTPGGDLILEDGYFTGVEVGVRRYTSTYEHYKKSDVYKASQTYLQDDKKNLLEIIFSVYRRSYVCQHGISHHSTLEPYRPDRFFSHTTTTDTASITFGI